MRYKVRVSPDVYKYFNKADIKIKKRMVKDLQTFEELVKNNDLNNENLLINGEVHYYKIQKNATLIYIIKDDIMGIIDYIHEVDNKPYSILVKQNPFENIESNAQQ